MRDAAEEGKVTKPQIKDVPRLYVERSLINLHTTSIPATFSIRFGGHGELARV
jgi:hypothetical protein